jgi:hypothetical protein
MIDIVSSALSLCHLLCLKLRVPGLGGCGGLFLLCWNSHCRLPNPLHACMTLLSICAHESKKLGNHLVNGLSEQQHSITTDVGQYSPTKVRSTLTVRFLQSSGSKIELRQRFHLWILKHQDTKIMPCTTNSTPTKTNKLRAKNCEKKNMDNKICAKFKDARQVTTLYSSKQVYTCLQDIQRVRFIISNKLQG